MFRNIYYDRQKSEMHVWYEENGEPKYKIKKWVPCLYKKTNEDTGIKSIYGDNVKKLKFKSYKEYNAVDRDFFIKSDDYKLTKKMTFNHKYDDYYENHTVPETQYLAEFTHQIDDEKIEAPSLNVYSLDIEVHAQSFPDPAIAKDPITLIGLHIKNKNKFVLFGEKPYTKESEEDLIYFHCKTEKELLEKFFDFLQKHPPDIITGWNIILNNKMGISGFDVPYIVNRTKNLFGDDTKLFYKFSPINKGTITKDKKSGGINFVPAGVAFLDYMALYKWYSRNKVESYSLDYVSKFELDEGKLDYSEEYQSLDDLYNNNWNLYVDYNIIDCKRVSQLEDKLDYIKLTQSLCLLTRCTWLSYNAVTYLIDGRMLVCYRRNGVVAPAWKGGTQLPYEGAFVKEPKRGLYNWLLSVDIASSYPTAIITLNMSTETYYGKIDSLTREEVVHYTKKREFPEFELYNILTNKRKIINGDNLKRFNVMVERGLLAIAPTGALFKTTIPGVLAKEEKELFFKRKEVKKLMFQTKDKIEKAKLKSLQLAIKLWLNSLYGATAVPYSRYFNLHIAEAIPSCAKNTILQGEKYVNEILNDKKLLKNSGIDGILQEIKEFKNE